MGALMHEISIARSLLELLSDQQSARNFTRVRRANVRIGPLSGVDGTALRSAFNLIASGTCAEGCFLEIEYAVLNARCSSCGNEFEIRNYVFACHLCQSKNIELLTGDEIVLSEMEVESLEEEGMCPN